MYRVSRRTLFSHGRIGGRRAQALVEFALLLPIMLILLIGMIDFGRAFVFGVAVQQGAREAARVAAQAGLDTTVTDARVLQRLVAASSPALSACAASTDAQSCGGGSWSLSVTYTPSRSSGAQVQVQAVGHLTLLSAYLTSVIGITSVPLTGEAAMQVI